MSLEPTVCGGSFIRPAGTPAPCCCRAVAAATLTFFVDNIMDRAENFDSMDLALFRADDVKRSTARRTGWKEDA